MKQLTKILACLLLLLSIALCFVACGDDPTPTPDGPGTGGQGGGGGGGNTDVILENIYTRNIKFNDGEIPYDGNLHTWESYTGNTDPERTDCRFEYWKDGVKVADGGVGVSEAGSYEVRLYFFAEGYKETYVTATLTIVSSYNISYAVGDGMTLPAGVTMDSLLAKDSPTIYADNTKDMLLLDATLAEYKFKGWYLDSAYTQPISVINGKEMGSKDVTLYAKFQPYLPYPMPFEYDTNIQEAPNPIPAIPGYDRLTEGATPILDMQYVHKDSTEVSMGQKYQTPETDKYWFVFNDYELTAGGQPVVQWIDYNDTFAGLWPEDSETIWAANDGLYNGSMNFYSPIRTEYSKYDTVEFWLYSANSTVTETNPQGSNIALIMWTDGNDGKTLRYSIPLNFSGWKKFTLRISDFKAVNASNLNITRVSFFAYDIHGEKANLAENKSKNFIYLSNMFLTSYASSYKTTGAIPDGTALDVLETFETFTIGAPSKTDAEIATILDKVASGDAIFSDITVTNQHTLAECYNRILTMAEVWNAPESAYYQDADLLNTIGVALNKATALAQGFLSYALPVDESITSCCLDAVKTALIIGDHFEVAHAESWMMPVLHYFPSSTGAGVDALVSSFIFTGAQLALNQNMTSISGFYQMTHLLANREISVSINPADVVPVMSMIRAAYGTSFYPVGNDFINDMFAWFYECVDALTYQGKLAEGIEGSIVPYIRGMLMIYDLAPEATQNAFASYVKYYMEQDSGLKAALEDAMYYDIEAITLEKIESSSVTAATAGNVSLINSALGIAIYRTDDFFFLLTQSGQLIVNGITLDYVPTASTLFEGIATDDTLALLTDGKQILVNADGVQLFDSQGYIIDDEKEIVIIGANDINKNMSAVDDLLFYESNAACIVLIEKTEDTYTVTINNYTGVEDIITLYIDGDLEVSGSELNVDYNYNRSDKNTRLDIDFTKIDGEVYTFTLTVY